MRLVRISFSAPPPADSSANKGWMPLFRGWPGFFQWQALPPVLFLTAAGLGQQRERDQLSEVYHPHGEDHCFSPSWSCQQQKFLFCSPHKYQKRPRVLSLLPTKQYPDEKSSCFLVFHLQAHWHNCMVEFFGLTCDSCETCNSCSLYKTPIHLPQKEQPFLRKNAKLSWLKRETVAETENKSRNLNVWWYQKKSYSTAGCQEWLRKMCFIQVLRHF